MKTRFAALLVAGALLSMLAGCRRDATNDEVAGALLSMLAGCTRDASNDEVVAEGIIWSVEYTLENGRTGGFTRLNNSAGVPGGNGTWNTDAYGQLTRDYLIITYPQKKGLGPRIIPARRLVDIQFGDGGIKTVADHAK
jgi:hypothetical protein